MVRKIVGLHAAFRITGGKIGGDDIATPARSTMNTMTVDELNRVCSEDDVVLIDVRTPMEYRGVHVVGAVSVPLDQLDVDKVAEEHGRAGEPIYVICKSGSRSRQACEKFEKAGHDAVVCIDGGTDAWVAAGHDVERGKATMSLERQVRISAGALILIAVGIGFGLHPAGFGLSAFVGAGLVFAGVTDTCGMGLMLAKMPWNRVA